MKLLNRIAHIVSHPPTLISHTTTSLNRHLKYAVNTHALSAILVGVVLTTGITGCSDDDDDNSGSVADTTAAELSVTVRSLSSNQPVAGINVFDKDFIGITSTNAEGYAQLMDVPAGDDSLIQYLGSGYAKQYAVLPLATAPNLTLYPTYMVTTTANEATTDSGQITLSQGSTAKYVTRSGNDNSEITISYDKLQRLKSKTTPERDLTVFFQPLLADDSQDTNSLLLGLPNYNGVTISAAKQSNGETGTTTDKKNSQRQPLSVYGSVYLNINEDYVNQEANDADIYRQQSIVTIADDQALPIRIDVTEQTPASSSLPATVNLYYFDEAKGDYQLDSQLQLNTEQSAYTGTTSHIGYLVAALPVATTQSIPTCLVDSYGQPATSGLIRATGNNTLVYGYTDDKGESTLNVPANEALTFQARVGQYESNVLTLAEIKTLADQGQCITIANDDSQTATVTLTWESAKKDLDINAFLPTGEVLYFNNLGNLDTRPYAMIAEDSQVNGKQTETLDYKRLLVGTHRLFAYNANLVFDPNMIAAGTTLTVQSDNLTQSITPVSTSNDPLVDQKDSILIDNRSVAWYAADMQVADDCQITISEPDSSVYYRWLDAESYHSQSLRRDGELITNDNTTGRYCTKTTKANETE